LRVRQVPVVKGQETGKLTGRHGQSSPDARRRLYARSCGARIGCKMIRHAIAVKQPACDSILAVVFQ
jgi:hypothetical protein